MEYRLLGNTGLYVSSLSLGGWVTHGSQVENEVAFECMKIAYEKGCNFFDTAEVYAAGESNMGGKDLLSSYQQKSTGVEANQIKEDFLESI